MAAMPPTSDIPLSVLDLAPAVSGSTAAQALRNTIDLARKAEQFGYQRYWLAEHHLTPGYTSSAPAVLIAAVAAATRRIRVGSGAVQSGYTSAVLIAEQFGTLAQLHPGRVDLGLGRTSAGKLVGGSGPAGPAPAGSGGPSAPSLPSLPAVTGARAAAPNGLLIPAPTKLPIDTDRLRLLLDVVGYRSGAADDYEGLVRDIQAFIAGDYRSADGVGLSAPVVEGSDLQLWIMAATAGGSARTAGELGLPLAASYHIFPSAVLDTIGSYRAAFRPSAASPEPRVMVSADVVVAADDATARRLASGYGPWVASIRSGNARPYPSPDEVAALDWTDEDRALVADRVDTQFVGSPTTVLRGLRTLCEATGADELLVTTITHDHADRVRSYQLLAEAWRRFD